jgi:hypothetical protein
MCTGLPEAVIAPLCSQFAIRAAVEKRRVLVEGDLERADSVGVWSTVP